VLSVCFVFFAFLFFTSSFQIPPVLQGLRYDDLSEKEKQLSQYMKVVQKVQREDDSSDSKSNQLNNDPKSLTVNTQIGKSPNLSNRQL
jgi:hypothetical protein